MEIEPGIDGLVHVSDMSWTRRVEHPSEVVQKGDEVNVMVLDVDAENKRISLGIKQLQEDPWPQIAERFVPGLEIAGKVVRVQDKGVVVDLGDEIEGFVPASHSRVEDADRLEEYYGGGDPVDLRVVESDVTDRRVVLEVTTEPEHRPDRVIKPEVAEGADGSDGEELAEPGEQVEAVESVDVAEPVGAAGAIEAAEPVEVAESVEVPEPVEVEEPVEAVEPAEAAPAEPETPVAEADAGAEPVAEPGAEPRDGEKASGES